MFFIFLFPTLLLCFIFLKYLSWNFDYWKKRNFHGPTPAVWYGTFKKTATGECDLIEELDDYYEQYKATDKYIGVFAGRKPKLFVLDPLLAKQILTTQFKDFRINDSSKWSTPALDPLRFQSPFVCVGDDWKEKRSELTPALTTNRLRVFHAVFQASADKLVNYIRGHTHEPLDVKELINRFNADVLSRYIWDIKTNTDSFAEGAYSELHEMANRLVGQAYECVRYYDRTVNFPWLRKLFPVRFFPKVSDKFFLQLAAYALKMRESSSNVSSELGNVINHLSQLRDKKSLSDIQIAGHTTTVMIDGFETGAIVAAHLFLLLARNPRVQIKLREELNGVDENCSYEVLHGLQYLDQCINETMRIFPPLALLVKLCTTNVQLENKDGSRTHQLEAGNCLYISSYSFHRDGDYYANPETFWPERFDTELGGVRKYQEMGVFIPFGDGPRMCPGQKLSIAEIKMATSAILRHFIIRPGPKTRNDNKIAAGAFLISLEDGIELIFEEI